MPTYEYLCLDCAHKVEYFQKMSEAPVTECPVCKGRLTRMVSTGTGLIFKGSGFYITDYKKANSAPASHSNGPTSAPASGDATKSEAKPVDKKESTEKK